MESLINALDTIINNKSGPEIKEIWDQLLEPDKMLFLLLHTDVLMYINRGSQSIFRIKLLF